MTGRWFRMFVFLVATPFVAFQAEAGEAPTPPQNPINNDQCAAFNSQWWDYQEAVFERWNKTPAAGDQVTVGPCCTELNGGRECHTYASRKAASEELYCTLIEWKKEVTACNKAVRDHDDAAMKAALDQQERNKQLVRSQIERDKSAPND